VYAYETSGYSQLFIFDLVTGKERQLTTSHTDKYDARWSPDGGWIAFAANADGAVQAWKIKASGRGEQALTHGYERMRHVFFSPDGRWIYVQPSHRNIYRLPAEAGRCNA
jgi:Tol biopolymer transport system component